MRTQELISLLILTLVCGSLHSEEKNAPEPTGKVIITPTPSSAEIKIDSNLVSRDETIFILTPGQTEVVVSQKGYLSYKNLLNIKAGQTLVLSPELKRLSKKARFYDHSGSHFWGLFEAGISTPGKGDILYQAALAPIRIKTWGFSLINTELYSESADGFSIGNASDYRLFYRPEVRYYLPVSGHAAVVPYAGASITAFSITKTENEWKSANELFNHIDGVAGIAFEVNAASRRFQLPISFFSEYRFPIKKDETINALVPREGIYFGSRISLNWILGLATGGVTAASLLLF